LSASAAGAHWNYVRVVGDSVGRGDGRLTHVQVEPNVRIFFPARAVVMWTALCSVSRKSASISLIHALRAISSPVPGGHLGEREPRGRGEGERAYICTLRSASVALGAGGVTSTDSAMKPATKETTVVKKPKTFWPRTRAECIVAGFGGGGRWDVEVNGGLRL
jgi:hypothetical protein